MTIGIYIWENNINKKKYVGQSVNIERRKRNYIRCDKSINPYIRNAIKKHGIEKFTCTVIECDKSELNRLEQQYISDLKLTDRKYGYNIHPGGSKGPMSEETKKRLSKAMMGNIPWNLGKHWDEETREKISKNQLGKVVRQETKDKISKANIGRKFSEEHKKRISEALKGIKRPCGKDHMYFGKHRSEETRRKISETLKKRANE
jgi:group I intron endonuclease